MKIFGFEIRKFKTKSNKNTHKFTIYLNRNPETGRLDSGYKPKDKQSTK
jgi:hypothetical protein